MTTSRHPAPGRAGLTGEDLVALRQLSDRYADAVDGRDAAALARVFAPEGGVKVEAFDGGAEQRYDGAAPGGLLETLAPFERTFHHVGGAVFDAAEGGASGRVTCAAHHYRQGRDLVLYVRYFDRYQHHPERGWLIGARRMRVEWSERVPARSGATEP